MHLHGAWPAVYLYGTWHDKANLKKMHYTYILKLSNGRLYSGLTSDLVRRQKEHIQGKVKSTRNLRPLNLIFYEAFKNKKDAERRERYLKTDKGKKMLRVMLREYFKN